MCYTKMSHIGQMVNNGKDISIRNRQSEKTSVLRDPALGTRSENLEQPLFISHTFACFNFSKGKFCFSG